MIKNVKRTISLILILIAIHQISFGQFDKYSSFDQLDSLWVGYMMSNKLDSATLVFEYAQKICPEEDKDITYTLGFLYALTKRDSLAIEMWSYGQPKGYHFGLDKYQHDELFMNNEKFIALAKRDKQISDSLNSISHVEYEVKLPDNYSNKNSYPTLFVFHGGGLDMESAKINWTSKVIDKNLIAIYVQSYIIGFRYGREWHLNDEKTNIEFKAIYQNVIQEYGVDKDKIYLSGFSQSGNIVIDYAFREFLPVSGVILNCPSETNISDSLIYAFVENEKKIGIITGEKDWALSSQKKLIERVTKAGGNTKFTINEGIGHQFPPDFPTILDEYLNWIVE